MAWISTDLRTQLQRSRHFLLGLPSFSALHSPSTAIQDKDGWLPRVLLVAAVCILTIGAILWPSKQTGFGMQPGVPQALAHDEARIGLGVMQASFKAGDAVHLKEGEQVYILEATFHDWYKIENLNGNIGVSGHRRG